MATSDLINCCVLQLNLVRSNVCGHAILSDDNYSKFDILTFSDPWWDPIGHARDDHNPFCRLYSSIAMRQWDIFIPPIDFTDSSLSVIVYICKGHNIIGHVIPDVSNKFLNWILDLDMVVHNDLATHTQEGGSSRSTIDYTIPNACLHSLDTIHDWSADFSLGLGSDHAALTCSIKALGPNIPCSDALLLLLTLPMKTTGLMPSLVLFFVTPFLLALLTMLRCQLGSSWRP